VCFNFSSFLQVIDAVDEGLNDSCCPFFMGKEVSAVDVQFLSFLKRACASLLYFKGFQIHFIKGKNKFPAINRWFDAFGEKPSYQSTKSDYYTHAWDLPSELGGRVEE